MAPKAGMPQLLRSGSDRSTSGGVPLAGDEAVRFWQTAPQMPSEFVCAYFEAGRSVPHVHEEGQFAVPEIPSKLSVGAFRRYTARECDVTVVHPYDVHTEGGEYGSAPRW